MEHAACHSDTARMLTFAERVAHVRQAASLLRADDATLGTLVHLVLERLFDLPAEERTEDSAARALRPGWDEMLAKDPALAELHADDAALAAWFDEARARLRVPRSNRRGASWLARLLRPSPSARWPIMLARRRPYLSAARHRSAKVSSRSQISTAG